MEQETVLPKRLAAYIHDVGVRALDHLADAGDGHATVQPLVGHWRSLNETDKQQFVDKIAASIVEAIAASVLVPTGMKIGKKAARSARKVLKKRTKALRKSVKTLTKKTAGAAKKSTRAAKKTVEAV